MKKQRSNEPSTPIAVRLYTVAKPTLKLEIGAERTRRRQMTHRHRSMLEWIRRGPDWVKAVAGLLTAMAGLLTAMAGLLYAMKSQPADTSPPADAVEPQKPQFNPLQMPPAPTLPSIPSAEPVPTFGYRLVGAQVPRGGLPKPVQRAVQNAGTLATAGEEQKATEWLHTIIQTLGYADADSSLVMGDANTFTVVERPTVPRTFDPQGLPPQLRF